MPIETRILLDIALVILLCSTFVKALRDSRKETLYQIGVQDVGTQKIHVIKAIRECTGLGLAEAKAASEGTRFVAEGVTLERVREIKIALVNAGAHTWVRP
jgi:ribosomal protein L7/L12